MTIFLDIAKHFLTKAIDSERRRLLTSYTSNLPDYKSKEAEKLSKAILELVDQEDDDNNVKELNQLITECHNTVEKECRAQALPIGTFADSLVALSTMLLELHRVLGKNKLLNILPNEELTLNPKKSKPSLQYDNPLNIFQYYAALYVGEKALAPKNTIVSTVTSVFWSPVQVSDNKENVLMAALMKCEIALDELDKRKAIFPLARAKRVLDFIEKVIRDNADTCSSHAALQNGVSVVETFGATLKFKPTVKPSRGDLLVCMNKAREEVSLMIDTLKIILSKEKSKDPEDEEDVTNQLSV